METPMIDVNLLFALELCALTVLIGAGIWRIYRALRAPSIDAAAPVAHDMRHDGQLLSV